jgi:hypothetical protein
MKCFQILVKEFHLLHRFRQRVFSAIWQYVAICDAEISFVAVVISKAMDFLQKLQATFLIFFRL